MMTTPLPTVQSVMLKLPLATIVVMAVTQSLDLQIAATSAGAEPLCTAERSTEPESAELRSSSLRQLYSCVFTLSPSKASTSTLSEQVSAWEPTAVSSTAMAAHESERMADRERERESVSDLDTWGMMGWGPTDRQRAADRDSMCYVPIRPCSWYARLYFQWHHTALQNEYVRNYYDPQRSTNLIEEDGSCH